jgi:hypothetical protein
VAGVLMAACAATPATVAGTTGAGPRETLELSWTTKKPGAASGVTFSARYRNPANPASHPPALRRVVVVNPVGSRLDGGAVPRCEASDAQLEMSGDAACPSSSKVGSGYVNTLPLGLVPFHSEISIFNSPGGQRQLVKFGNGGSVVVHTAIRKGGRIFDTPVPTCLAGGQPPDGCPSDQNYVVSSYQAGGAITAHGRKYFRTPPTCPRARRWVVNTRFYFADGAIDNVATPQPCTRHARHRSRHRRHRRPVCHRHDDRGCDRGKR